jgi:hypothetical protein
MNNNLDVKKQKHYSRSHTNFYHFKTFLKGYVHCEYNLTTDIHACTTFNVIYNNNVK